MIDLDLRRLTPAERLWLWRRLAGLTQAAAAGRLRVPLRSYQRAEAGNTGCIAPPRAPRPSPGDLCALARRRSGLSLREAARRLGVSHVTLLAREGRGDQQLVLAWESLGFRFR